MSTQPKQQKITPHLWFDKEAKEAAERYVEIFGKSSSKISQVVVIPDTPSGDTEVVRFELWGYCFGAISAGPFFKFNPSISITVQCVNEEEIDRLYAELAKDGKELMPLGAYDWSKKYGWVADKYGLTWQLTLPNEADASVPKSDSDRISFAMTFTQDQAGKAEEAMLLYTSVFPQSKILEPIVRWGKGEPGTTEKDEGKVKFARFELFDGQVPPIVAMDSSLSAHQFVFNAAVSLEVRCDTQEELDNYFSKLSAYKEAEQCGWISDKFGVSWQIVPSVMDEMMATADKQQLARVTKAFLGMKKFDIATLVKAYHDQ